MEEREASVGASLTDFYDSDRKPETPASDSHHDPVLAKRKAEDVAPALDKKRKLDDGAYSPSTVRLDSCAGLPAEIWQHIFLSCSIRTLGRLLKVNRSFHSYLTRVQTVPHSKPAVGFVRLIKSESIWASARNAHPTKPPGPLPGFSEVDMWRLILGKTCQFCGKLPSSSPGEKSWEKGPGENGVRIIWPFGVRACGPCLLQRCEKDSNVIFTAASALRPALPYAIITTTGHYIPVYAVQGANLPPSVDITKYYYKGDIEQITQEFEEAQGRGLAAAEEWSKGLDSRGKKRMRTAEVWERWEMKYQWWLNHQAPRQRVSSVAPASPANQSSAGSPGRHIPSPLKHPVPPPASSVQFNHDRPPTAPPTSFTPHPPPIQPFPTPRSERNIRDANEAKAARKADIERRCQELHPPIPANILRHMESFKAAIQISQPMTDYAWEVLQPRLLAQLPAAEQAEAEHVSRVTSLQSRAAERRQQDVSLKEVKEVLDREWEEAMKPIRDKLNAIADEFINRDWNHGKAVTYENSPKFAVDLLLYVRREFYAAKFGDVSPAEGQVKVESTSESKLVLDNMKWVYDNKVKPLTEQFRKELFLCNGGGSCEGNTRFYGFEGVIQHYGAKHTNAFSVGNVVVAWREAEWPEEPPFHPDPIAAKHLLHSSTGQGHSAYNPYHVGYSSRADTVTPFVQARIAHASPGPYHPQYGNHYNGPYAPPPSQVPAYDYPHSYGGPPLDTYASYTSPSYGPPPGHSGYMTSPAMGHSALPRGQPSGQAYGRPGDRFPQAVPRPEAEDVKYRTNLFENQVSSVIRMAQEIWKQTSGVKDLPSSVRIYVLMQRIISKFQLEFNHEPTLDHLIDAFSNHQIPKGLKNASGLFCKACQEEFLHHVAVPYQSRAEDRRTYTVLNLFSHFKSQHFAHGPLTPGALYGNPATLDWKEDMLELPSDRVISGLIHAPGMTDEKLHMIATVFPSLFPTPLPRIASGVSHDAGSPDRPLPKDPKETSAIIGAIGLQAERSGPSSVASGPPHSPIHPKPSDEEYDPLRPALSTQSNQAARSSNRRVPYQAPPPSSRRQYSGESRYFLPRDSSVSEYPRPHSREYLDIGPNSKMIRDADSYEQFQERNPLYRDREEFFQPGPDGVLYTRHPHGGYQPDEYRPFLQEFRRRDNEPRRSSGYHVVREADPHESLPSTLKTEAEQFLDDFDPMDHSNRKGMDEPGIIGEAKPASNEAEFDDGSRYTPPPANAPVPPTDVSGPQRAPAAPVPALPSSQASGPRFEEYRSDGRQIPTPDSGGAPRKSGSLRRRDRPHDYVPSRYYRYMTVARDEQPYPRSVSRTQSRRYSRYEEQKRRLDQADTPQANPDADYDRGYSRDHSLDRQAEPAYHNIRHGSREYIPIEDPAGSYPPVHYRVAPGPPHGAPPSYVDQYGQPVELVRVHRDPRPYVGHPPTTRYVPEPNSDHHIQYVPLSYDRGHPPHAPRAGDPRYEEHRPYVYYEERGRPSATRFHTLEIADGDPGESTTRGTSMVPPVPGGPETG